MKVAKKSSEPGLGRNVSIVIKNCVTFSKASAKLVILARKTSQPGLGRNVNLVVKNCDTFSKRFVGLVNWPERAASQVWREI